MAVRCGSIFGAANNDFPNLEISGVCSATVKPDTTPSHSLLRFIKACSSWKRGMNSFQMTRVFMVSPAAFSPLYAPNSLSAGDESERNELSVREEEQGSDTLDFWSSHERMVNTVAWQSRSAPKPNEAIAGQSKSKADVSLQTLYNPWEGREDSRQLSETVSEFTKRLPPLASTHVGPWIWIANPHLKDRSEPELRNVTFIQLASRELKQFIVKKENLTSTHPEMGQGTVARTLKPHRDQLKEDILRLAKEHGTVWGKVGSSTSEFPLS